MIRQADEIRDFLYQNLLTTYNPAVEWTEDEAPFDIDAPILYCRQEGLGVDAFVRQVSVDVIMFSKKNATKVDTSQLYTDATAALNYLKFNFNVGDIVKITVTQDVTGEYRTGQERRYYRFQVLCYALQEEEV
jgi:hypothetical protein